MQATLLDTFVAVVLQAVANSEAALSAAIAEANRGVAEVEGVQEALEEQQHEYQNLMQHMRVRYVCVIAADAFGFCLMGCWGISAGTIFCGAPGRHWHISLT
mgnify:CR=1 FL=1